MIPQNTYIVTRNGQDVAVSENQITDLEALTLFGKNLTCGVWRNGRSVLVRLDDLTDEELDEYIRFPDRELDREFGLLYDPAEIRIYLESQKRARTVRRAEKESGVISIRTRS